MEIKEKMLSKYQQLIANFHNILIGNVKKLVPDFFDKEKYVLHYENFQLYLRLGLKLKKIHRVLEFIQSQWLKPYIEFNTQKGIEAKKKDGKKKIKFQKKKKENKDGKQLYNLMNNAIYGKAMENLRNRIDVKLVNKEKDDLKCTLKPSYMSHKIFDNNLVAIRKSKIALTLKKPAYIGMCILDLIKV